MLSSFIVSFFLLPFMLTGDLRETAYRPGLSQPPEDPPLCFSSFHTASAKEVIESRGKVWLPKPRTYCGENEYSIRPHKPNSVGATPASATNAPTPQTRVLAERSPVYERGGECDLDTGGDCKGLPTPQTLPYQALNGMVYMAVLCLEMGRYRRVV